MDLLLFILVSIGLIIVPGPNVLVIVSTSIAHGRPRGLQTVSGTSVAMIIQLLIAALGAAWLVEALSSGFFWLKWAGVAYLLYLGAKHLRNAASKAKPEPVSAIGSFQRGFWVSVTNPKTILFFASFLPQFVSASEDYLPQIAQLSVVFWSLAVILDSGYALLASKLAKLLENKKLSKMQNCFSGLLYIGAGATLAATRHGQ